MGVVMVERGTNTVKVGTAIQDEEIKDGTRKHIQVQGHGTSHRGSQEREEVEREDLEDPRGTAVG